MTRARWMGMLTIVLRPTRVFASLIVALAATSSCAGGTETGNPSLQAELSYTAFSSDPSQVGVREAASQATIENAWLDLDRVQLLGSCGEASGTAQIVPALGVGDHAAGKHNLTRFDVASGAYCGLELPFARVTPHDLSPDAPPGLAQHSIMIDGTLADGTHLTILSSATPTVRLVADSGSFELDAAHAQTLIAFDLASWIADLNFDSATRTEQGIEISAQQNPALLAEFEQRLASGIALYQDADGDGKLDVNPLRLAHGE